MLMKTDELMNPLSQYLLINIIVDNKVIHW